MGEVDAVGEGRVKSKDECKMEQNLQGASEGRIRGIQNLRRYTKEKLFITSTWNH